jgi:AraC-like DNA-binding protein
MPGHHDSSSEREQSSSPLDAVAAVVTRLRLGGYREYAPPAAMAHFCDALWMHRTTTAPAQASPGAAHRVLPGLGVSLAFQGFRADDGTPIATSPFIIGPTRHAHVFDLVPGRELAAVRIKPEWVGPLLGIDPLAIENQVTELRGVHPELADRLQDALGRTRSVEAAVRVLMDELVRVRTAAGTPPSGLTAASLELVRRSGGRLPCERLASAVGLSERHFRRQVHDSTGVSPKTYARVLRFVGAMLTADRQARPAWADIAVQAGYCDQSHLIRECVALAGGSPAELHAERRSEIAVEAR